MLSIFSRPPLELNLSQNTLLSKNIEFIFSVTYNMIEYLRNNSTEHKVVGYTEFGKKLAEDYKKNKKKKQDFTCTSRICAEPNARFLIHYTYLLILKTEYIITMLVCSAYDFYPKPIKLMWMRDEMMDCVKQALAFHYYQCHTLKPGEKISCVVEHASSHKPMIYHWDPSLPESERSKIILGAVGLLMGVFIAGGGLIYYKRKHTGWYSCSVLEINHYK
uniref:Ig-like domain-containing protein n=1 Tax=Cyprinus carpio TaxID=7962 RepID=A0A8C1KYA0_CYPCA